MRLKVAIKCINVSRDLKLSERVGDKVRLWSKAFDIFTKHCDIFSFNHAIERCRAILDDAIKQSTFRKNILGRIRRRHLNKNRIDYNFPPQLVSFVTD